jgi:transglutaminase-like putative cysteine protease
LSRKTIQSIGIAVGIFVLAGVALLLIFVGQEEPQVSSEDQPNEVHYPITKRIRYRLEVRNMHPQAVQNATVKVLAPLPLTATQQRQTLEADQPYKLERDPVGNEWLVFDIEVLAPLGRKLITITSALGMAEDPQSQQFPAETLERYLSAERHIESDAPLVQERAVGLKQPEVHATADRVYQNVRETLRYSGPVSEPRGARYALREERGDCTEYAYLFTALMRANGVPARPVRGFVYPHDALLDPADLHDWSEYHHEGIWYLADPLKGALRSETASYIAMRWVDSITPTPGTDPERMVWASAGIEARLVGRRE